MIEKLLNKPHILHQPVDDDQIPEQPIAACVDADGLICLSQEGRDIVVRRKAVPELIKLLRQLALLLLFVMPAAAQNTTVTGTFKTQQQQTPGQAGLEVWRVINGVNVYGYVEFTAKDVAGRQIRELTYAGVTFIPPVRGYLDINGQVINNAAQAGVLMVPNAGATPSGTAMCATIFFNKSADGEMQSQTLSGNHLCKSIPDQPSVDWASLAPAAVGTVSIAYQLQTNGAVSGYEDWGASAAPANPAASTGRVWFDSATSLMKCKTSSGGDCLPGTSDQDILDIAAITRTRGDLIVGGASAWIDLVIGGSNTFLRSDGIDPAWVTLAKSHLPAAIAYEDEANVFTAGQAIDNQLGLQLRELDANGDNYVELRSSAARAANYTLTIAVTGDCTANVNGGALTINASNEIVCSDDDGGAGSGDNISVAGAAATDANFIDTARIDVTLNTTPTPDEISFTIVANSLSMTADMAAFNSADFAGRISDEYGVDGVIPRVNFLGAAVNDVLCVTDVTGGSENLGVCALSQTFQDNLFRVEDNTDTTKEAAVDVGSNVATGTTITVKWPSAPGTFGVSATAPIVLNATTGNLTLTQHAGTDVTADLEEEAHASEHQHGGADEIATATAGANAIPKAGAGGTLADGWLSANVSLLGQTIATAEIENDAVTFAKMQNITSDRLLGRDTAASGDPEEISLGNGLSWSGSQSITVDWAATKTLTNTTMDVEGTGNSITTVGSIYLDAASCSVATAALQWDDAGNGDTAPPAACNDTGAIQRPSADFSGSAVNTFERTFRLPPGWTGNIDVTLTYVSVAASPTGNVEWDISTVCRAAGESWDGTFNAAQTITDAVGIQNNLNDATQTSITTTGCSAGEHMTLRISRDGTNDTNNDLAKLVMVEITTRRIQ